MVDEEGGQPMVVRRCLSGDGEAQLELGDGARSRRGRKEVTIYRIGAEAQESSQRFKAHTRWKNIRGRGGVAMRNKWLQNGAGRHNRGHGREESFVVKLEIWHLWIDALSSNA